MESPSQCAAVIHPPPGSAEAPWKRLKSEPERPLKGNPEEDDEFNDPEHQILPDFEFDAVPEDEIEKKEGISTQKKVKKKGLIRRGPPQRGGGMCLLSTDCDHIRAKIIQFSQLALEKYNAKIQKNKGEEEEMFVFHDFVKATYRPCGIYFITFQAKKIVLTKKKAKKIAAVGGGDGADAILTFLAKVVHAFGDPPRVMSCFLKPT